jgi:hypothetical protein
MISDHDRQQSEKRFRREERSRDGRTAMTEHEVRVQALHEKTARLKALRLAKEAEVQNSSRDK